jgi:hypothetical protein
MFTKMNIETATRNFLVRILFVATLSISSITPGRAQTFSLANSTSIAINDSGTPSTMGNVHSSTISVTDLDWQSISHISVTVHALTHTLPSDLDIMLAGPVGHLSLLTSEVDGNNRFSVSLLTHALDDSAANSLLIDNDRSRSGNAEDRGDRHGMFCGYPGSAQIKKRSTS